MTWIAGRGICTLLALEARRSDAFRQREPGMLKSISRADRCAGLVILTLVAPQALGGAQGGQDRFANL